jgi:phage terminase Nu1 subunit (DNA packaging protein)
MSSETQAVSTDANVLAGCVTRKELAKQLDRTERTVGRLVKQGMPEVRLGPLGRIILYRVEAVREWLLSFEKRRGVPTTRPARRRRAAR